MSSESSSTESIESAASETRPVPAPDGSGAQAGSGGGSTEGNAPKRRRRRWPWLVLASLVALVVGLRVALPTLIERGAAYGSRYWLGLPARIDNADFALLDGVVVLEGVRVGARPDDVEPMDAAFEPPEISREAALLSLDRISLALSWSELREGRVRIGDLTLKAPAVRVVRENDGAIDPLRHARPLAPPSEEEAEEEEEAGEPWPLAVDMFLLQSPNVVVVDSRSGEDVVDLSLESFELDDIAFDGEAFSLGGLGIDGPVLRVRRDLVFADTPAEEAGAAEEATPAAADAPQAKEAAPAEEALPGDEAVTAEKAPPAEAAAPEDALAEAEEAQENQAVAEDTAADTAEAPPGFRIEKLDIERARFTWVTDKGPLDVALTLSASDISADEGKLFPVRLGLEVDDGSIALEGKAGILPPSYVGKLTWKGLPFPPLLLASVPDLAEWLRSADSAGDLSLDIDVAGLRGPPSLRFSGQATVDKLAIADPGDEEVALGWKKLEVVLAEARIPLPETGAAPATTVARFDRIALVAPKIRYTHPAPKLFALLGLNSTSSSDEKGQDEEAENGEAEPAAPEPSTVVVAAPKDAQAEVENDTAPAVDVTISTLELTSGDLEVLDRTVEPPVTSTVKQLSFSARDVHFPDPEAADVKLRAVLPKSSALKVDGNLRPGNNGEFTLTLQKLDLPLFDPYAAGASLESGQASLKTNLKLRGAKISADSDLVLRKFGISLGDPSAFEDTFGMPLDLVLALLRDPSGEISLSIPVKIDEKGSTVSLTSILASTLRAALVGALSAPLKMLGAGFNAFRGDDDEGDSDGLGIPPVPSVPGGAAAGEGAEARIEGLAKLLRQRPAMGLLLSGRTGEADRAPVAEQILAERLEDGDGLPDLEDSGFLARRRIRDALEARASGDSEAEPLSAEDRALYDRYVASVTIEPARLDELARQRAEAVRDLLVVRKIEAERLEIGERDEQDGSPGVVVSLKVH